MSDLALSVKKCDSCNLWLPIANFSLKRGHQSAERKPVCSKCEYANRIDKKTGLTNAVKARLLKAPCSICSCTATRIDFDDNGKPIGVLCEKCEMFLHLELNENRKQSIQNYVTMKTEMPVVGRALMEYHLHDGDIQSTNPEPKPLLAYIEEYEQNKAS